MDIKALLKTHKVKTAFVGGALVVSTAWGSCHFTPVVPAPEPEPAVEEEVAAPTEEESEAKEDDASEGK